MKLQTTIPLTPESNQIDYASSVVLLGSCFTENIGGKLAYYKFSNLQNPFGVLFHPLATEGLLQRIVENRMFSEADVFCHAGIWHSFEVHSLVNATSSEAMVALLNKKLQTLRTHIDQASHLIVTFGTAWIYRHAATHKIVANCHKVPNKEFSKEFLSVTEVATSVENIKRLVKQLNPKVTLIATVSPVRHLKDGFEENMRSKSHLIAGIHSVTGVSYFPAYELMMDELRDYRFYKSDLLHPNDTAIEIIWDRFQRVWIAPSSKTLQKEIDVIQKGLQHRPFHPESEAHREFQVILQQKIKALKLKLPQVSFDN